MYHSVAFGEKNTWDDWHLVPTSRPVFNPPSVKTKTLDIPGGDGLIDLTESLAGYPVYNNREGSMEFVVLNEFCHLVKSQDEWQEVYSSIMDYLHGQEMIAVLEDDKEYYYKGRFTVNSWKSDSDYSKITIDYSVEPYKWCLRSLLGDWLADPFNAKAQPRYSYAHNYILNGDFSNNSLTNWVRPSSATAMTYDGLTCARIVSSSSISYVYQTITVYEISTFKIRFKAAAPSGYTPCFTVYVNGVPQSTSSGDITTSWKTFEFTFSNVSAGSINVSFNCSVNSQAYITDIEALGPYTPIIKDIAVTSTTKTYKFSQCLFGRAPIYPSLIVSATSSTTVYVQFSNSQLGITYSAKLLNGTTELPDIVLYGDIVSMSFWCISSDLDLLDSSGDAIQDSNGNTINGQASATVSIDLRPGRL